MASDRRTDSAASLVGWTLVAYGATLLVATLLGSNASGAAAIQVVVAEFAAGRLAVTWSDPLAPAPTWVVVARRLGQGLAEGVAIAVVIVVVALVTRVATLHAARASVAGLAMGVTVAALAAIRDELVLRGMVLRAFAAASPPWGIVICALAAAAARAGSDGASAIELASAGAFGAVMAGAWMRDRGAWLAIGAHLAFRLVLGPLTRGELVDVRPRRARARRGAAETPGSTRDSSRSSRSRSPRSS
jgi:membrane protease YdiL (CAAX protease family)